MTTTGITGARSRMLVERSCRAPGVPGANTDAPSSGAPTQLRGTPRTARARCRGSRPRSGADGSRSSQVDERPRAGPASASTRTTSPSRTRQRAARAASGVQWIAAGTLPDAPDMRPSVTSATRWPRSMQHAERGRELVQLAASRSRAGPGGGRRRRGRGRARRHRTRRASCDWSSNTRAGASIDALLGATAETFITARPSEPSSTRMPPSGANGVARRAQDVVVAATRRSRAARRSSPLVEVRLVAVAPEAVARDGVDVGVHAARRRAARRSGTARRPAAWKWLMSAAPLG